MKTALLQLSEIVTTAGTQIRSCLDTNTVDDYATAMVEGAVFPPIVVFHDGSRYILADGFHRVMAATRNGFKDIECEVHKGAKSDALKYALGANSKHGLKRTNADKRRSVVLALNEWPKLSDSKLAELCAVSQPFVGDVRREHITVIGSNTRVGRDGKERKMPTPKPQPELDPQPKSNDQQWREVLPTAQASEFPKDLEGARLEIILGHLAAVEEGLPMILKPENRKRIQTAANHLAAIARHEPHTQAAA